MPSLKSSALLAAIVSVFLSSSAAAQDRVIVVEERTTIWTANFGGIATVVEAGTILEVVARRGIWYEVLLPQPSSTVGKTGFVPVISVKPVDAASDATSPRGQAQQPQGRSVRSARPKQGFRGFGDVGYGHFNASQSFSAVLGDANGFWFGGGGEFRFARHWFVEGSLERFRESGERVFVFDDQVFKLGISDTVTIMPLAFTVGYRRDRPNLRPYIGGGLGRYFFEEESDFTDPSEDTSEQVTSYHVLGGVEAPIARLLALAFEAQYTHAPGAFDGGAAFAFDEDNLGGFVFRVKIVVGR